MSDKYSMGCFMLVMAAWSGASLLASESLAVNSPDGNLSISCGLKSNPQPYTRLLCASGIYRLLRF